MQPLHLQIRPPLQLPEQLHRRIQFQILHRIQRMPLYLYLPQPHLLRWRLDFSNFSRLSRQTQAEEHLADSRCPTQHSGEWFWFGERYVHPGFPFLLIQARLHYSLVF